MCQKCNFTQFEQGRIHVPDLNNSDIHVHTCINNGIYFVVP